MDFLDFMVKPVESFRSGARESRRREAGACKVATRHVYHWASSAWPSGCSGYTVTLLHTDSSDLTLVPGGPLFKDRRDAGRRLCQALLPYKAAPNTCILALPRGGVVAGDEISRGLQIPLEVLVTRKLGAPGNPELAMGALVETGYRYINPFILSQATVSEERLAEEVRRQQEEIHRQVQRYRQGRPLPTLSSQRVILVDDGLATGATFFASLAALRALGVASLIAAVPVAPPYAKADLASRADSVIVLETPEQFFAIGQFYEDFAQVEDEEVLSCLSRSRATSSET